MKITAAEKYAPPAFGQERTSIALTIWLFNNATAQVALVKNNDHGRASHTDRRRVAIIRKSACPRRIEATFLFSISVLSIGVAG